MHVGLVCARRQGVYTIRHIEHWGCVAKQDVSGGGSWNQAEH